MKATLGQQEIITSYAGDVTSETAWKSLSENPHAHLIDVRTVPEWFFVGCPDLSSLEKKLVTISWLVFPNMEVNRFFIQELNQSVPNKEDEIYFICRTGGRSRDAAVAASQAGYSFCYNIEDGFEGDLNQHGHRGQLTGWKTANLPWEQN